MSVNAYDPTTDSLILLAAGTKKTNTVLTVTTDISRLYGETVTVTDGKEILTGDFSQTGRVTFELANLGTYTITCDIYSTSVNNEDYGSSLSAEVEPTIVSWSTGTDEQITAMIESYYNGDLTLVDIQNVWSVGDTRTIHLNEMTAPNPYSGTWSAQDITVVILDFDHTTLATPINGKTKSLITVQTRECMNNNNASGESTGHIFVNGDSAKDTSFTKWSNLYMRTYLNSTVFGAIPSGSFKSAIKSSINNRLTTNGANPMNGGSTPDRTTESVTDKLFLPSYPEIFGNISNGLYLCGATPNSEEGTQFSYYATAVNRIKYGNNNGASNGVAQYWWGGSAFSRWDDNGFYWSYIYQDGETYSASGASACALAPCFAM